MNLTADPLLTFLLDVALAATALAAAFLLLLALLRRQPAPLRLAVALAGVAALLLVPIAAAISLRAGIGVRLLPAASPPAVAPQTIAPSPAVQEMSASQQHEVAMPDVRTTLDAVPTVVPTPWSWPSAGALLLGGWLAFALLRLGRDLARAARLRRWAHALPPASPALAAQFAIAAADLGIAALPPLHQGRDVACPATIGGLRPIVVTPADLLASGTGAATAMLRHELAHVALGHHRQAMLALLVRATFGWHPFAAALLAALAAAQEDVADNAATGAPASDRTGYARSLLAMAEHALAPTTPLMLSALGRSPLARRIARLLGQETESMLHTTPAGRAFAATVMVAAVTATFSFRLAPAQAPAAQEKEHSQSGAAYLPLQQDASWTWKVTQKSGDDVRSYQLVAWDFGLVAWDPNAPPDGRACHQLITTDDQTPGEGVQYWSANSSGIWEHDREYLGNLRGVGQGRTRLVPAPLGVEVKWQWDSQMSYQTMSINGAEPPARDPEQDRIHHTGELVALDEAITVPAGKFQAAHVRITSTCKAWGGDSTRELWFARGTGIVKEVETGPSGSIVRELTAHQPGKKVANDPAIALERVLAREGDARQVGVELLPAGDCYVRGRFAVVHPGAGKQLRPFYIEGAEVTEIHADDLEFWRGRCVAMHTPAMVQAKKDGTVWHEGNGTASKLLDVFARLEGRRAGCSDLQPVNSVSGSLGREDWAEDARFDGKNDKGEPIRLLGRFTFNKDGLTRVESHISPRK